MTTQPLAELATAPDLERTATVPSKSEARSGNHLVLWGLIIMFIGAAIGIVGKKLMGEDIVTVVGALIALVGMFLTGYAYLSPSRPKQSQAGPASSPAGLTTSQASRYLAPASNTDYLPSVTERTTDLLKTSAATRPRQNEDNESRKPQKSGRREEP